MDEISKRLLSSYSIQKHRFTGFHRLLGAFLSACLMLGFWGASASAMSVTQTPSLSTLSIPQGSAPAGWKTVNYGTVTIAIPASWPVYDLNVHPERCVLFNTHAVYLGHQGPDAHCPARVVGKSEALQLEPLTTADSSTGRLVTATTTVAGVSAQVDPSSNVSHTFIVSLSQAKVVIRLSYGHVPTLAQQILSTLHVSTKSSSTSNMPSRTTPQGHPKITLASQASGPFTGKGFDTCAAPSLGAMSAWLNSPYRAVGIYIGGANRACGDGNLSASWVNTVTGSGWSLMPIYVGLQAPCNSGFATIDPNQAASQGTQAADDAINRAQSFGLGNGTLLLNDMESYNNANSSCSQAVMTFLSAWTQELHARNYLSGVYSSLGSGIADLANNIGRIQEPDTIWFAHWDGVATTSDSAIPSGDWPNHQRIKQYLGGHNETWGNVTINIDNDQLDAVLHTTGISINGQPLTTHGDIGLTAASVNNQSAVYLAYTGTDSSHHLNIARSTTGNANDFSNLVTLTDSSDEFQGPSLCYLNGRLYVAFEGSETVPKIHVGWFDGSNQLQDDVTLPGSTSAHPTISGYNGQLYITWRGNGGSGDGHINLASSSDGKVFGPVTTFADTTGVSASGHPTSPFINVMKFNGQSTYRLYVAWLSPNPNGAINISYYDSANPTSGLQSHQILTDTTSVSPALISFGGWLWLGWGGTDTSHSLQVAASTDGVTFQSNRQDPCALTSVQYGPAFANFNAHLYIAYGQGNSQIGYCGVS